MVVEQPAAHRHHRRRVVLRACAQSPPFAEQLLLGMLRVVLVPQFLAMEVQHSAGGAETSPDAGSIAGAAAGRAAGCGASSAGKPVSAIAAAAAERLLRLWVEVRQVCGLGGGQGGWLHGLGAGRRRLRRCGCRHGYHADGSGKIANQSHGLIRNLEKSRRSGRSSSLAVGLPRCRPG